MNDIKLLFTGEKEADERGDAGPPRKVERFDGNTPGTGAHRHYALSFAMDKRQVNIILEIRRILFNKALHIKSRPHRLAVNIVRDKTYFYFFPVSDLHAHTSSPVNLATYISSLSHQ